LRRCAEDVTSPSHRLRITPPAAAVEFIMRAETQGLIEEIKQSLRLLRRHL